MRRWQLIGLMILWAAGSSAAPAGAEGDGIVAVARFSSGEPGGNLPEGWKPLTFKKIPKLTRYELVRDGAHVVVKAVSESSASGLTKALSIDPKAFPIVQWRWKVENLVQKSDATRKDGDDYPARLYITFEYDPGKVGLGKKLKYKAGQVLFGDIPIGAINYIWETRAPIGAIFDNAYTDFVKMVVVESGTRNLGRWTDESRNIYEDYKRAFGEEPPMINGIAIMSDTDNTGEQATAYYGDITFLSSP
jgi:hypothetical protein